MCLRDDNIHLGVCDRRADERRRGSPPSTLLQSLQIVITRVAVRRDSNRKVDTEKSLRPREFSLLCSVSPARKKENRETLFSLILLLLFVTSAAHDKLACETFSFRPLPHPHARFFRPFSRFTRTSYTERFCRNIRGVSLPVGERLVTDDYCCVAFCVIFLHHVAWIRLSRPDDPIEETTRCNGAPILLIGR